MDWVIPAQLGSVVGSLVLVLTYFNLYLHERQKHLAFWLASWSLYAVRSILEVLLVFWGKHTVLVAMDHLGLVWAAAFLLWGTLVFSGKKLNRHWLMLFAGGSLWIVVVFSLRPVSIWFTIPSFLLSALANIATGVALLRFKEATRPARLTTGWSFIVWGLHKMDYPFLRPYLWAAPLGYGLGAILGLVSALGVVLLYLEKTRNELKASEEKYRSIFENAAEGIFQITPEGQCLRVNPALAQMFGYDSPGEVLNSFVDLSNWVYADPGDRTRIRALLAKQGFAANLETKMLKRDGQTLWVSVNARAVKDETGAVRFYEGSMKDITDQKKAEEDLLTSRFQLLGAAGLARIAYWEYDEASDEYIFNDVFYELFGTDASREGGYRMPRAEYMKRFVHPDDVHELRRQIEENKIRRPLADHEQYEHRGVRADGEVMHILTTKRVIADDRGRRVKSVGVNQDITERKKAEEALRESEELYRIAIESSNDGVAIVKEKRYSFVNQRFLDIFGYERGEIIGKPTFTMVHPDDREAVAVHISAGKRQKKERINYDFRGVTKDGSIKFIEASMAKVVYLGEPAGLAYLKDITARKGAEEALRASHERYRVLFDEATEGIALADYETGIIRDCNKAFLKLTGYDRLELIGRPQKMLHPKRNDGRTFNWSFELARAEKHGQILTDFIATKSGAVKEVEIKTDVIELNGSKIMQGFFRDMTEERGRRREKETTLALLKVLTAPNETRDVAGDAMEILQGWAGCEAAGVRLQAGDDFPYVHTNGFSPDFVDRENSICAGDGRGSVRKDSDGTSMLKCRCGAVISGRDQEALQSLTPGGSFIVKGMENSGNTCPADALCDKEGYRSILLIPLKSGGGVLGLLQFNDRRRDFFTPEKVSFLENSGEQIAIALAQRLAREALATSERRFRDISEAAGEFLLETDSGDRFIFVSDRVKEVLEYDPAELIGRRPSDVIPLVDKERIAVFFSEHLRKRTGFRDQELRVLTKSGRIVWLSVTAVPILDDDGALMGYRGAAMDITQRKRAEEQLLHDALYDDLTGLPNRALFMDRLGHSLKASGRTNNDDSCAVIFLDLDRFKVVNDSLGHMVGDRLLEETARRLEKCVRPGDTVARLGGDEFVMLLQNVTEIETAKSIADRIQEVLSLPFFIEGNETRCSASIGIALTSKDYTTPEEVLRDADITMYRAKTLGKARYEVFDPAMRLEAAAILRLENDLRRALDKNELLVLYQPIVALREGRIVGVEALLRWQHPRRGLVCPDQFIPLAEETGLIAPIGEWVLRKACTQMKDWCDKGLEHVRIAVNVSAVQLHRSDFVDLAEKAIQQTGMDPGLLDLEITESVLMGRSDSIVEKLQKLKALGARICLDDFGVGYSSLSYLQGLPISVLKIDRSFAMNLAFAKENRKIIETILGLGRSLDAAVVAEGIETQEQLDYLKAMDCDYGQGFFFSEPVDAKAIEALVGVTGARQRIA